MFDEHVSEPETAWKSTKGKRRGGNRNQCVCVGQRVDRDGEMETERRRDGEQRQEAERQAERKNENRLSLNFKEATWRRSTAVQQVKEHV